MILVDTGAIYALTDRNDKNHRQAKEFYASIVRRETLGLPLPVLTESYLLLEARLGHFFANKVWEAAINGVFELLVPTEEDLRTAWRMEQRYAEAELGFVDAVCFALCERYKISKVFTYDRRHFALYRPSFASHLELLP